MLQKTARSTAQQQSADIRLFIEHCTRELCMSHICCEGTQTTVVTVHLLFDAVLSCALRQCEAVPVHLGGSVWGGYRRRC